MFINDVEIFFHFFKVLSILGVGDSIVSNIYDEDGPYFAFTKAEKYVLKITKAK